MMVCHEPRLTGMLPQVAIAHNAFFVEVALTTEDGWLEIGKGKLKAGFLEEKNGKYNINGSL